MKQKVLILLLVGLIGSTTSTIVSAQMVETANWPQWSEIILPSLSQTGQYVRLELPMELGLGSYSWRDLRIVTGNNTEVPYQLIKEEAEDSVLFRPVRMLNYSTDSAGRTIFILENTDEVNLHNAVRLISETRNFRANVEVKASDDLLTPNSDSWRTLTSTGYIFSFYDQETRLQTGQNIVSYPDSTARYLQITVTNESGRPLSIDQAHLQNRLTKQPRVDQMMVLIKDQSLDPDRNITLLEIDLNSKNVTSSALELQTSSNLDFHRDVLIEVKRNDRWVVHHRGEIFKLDTGRFKGQHLTISYPEVTTSGLRVQINNRNSSPINWSETATLSSSGRSLIWLASPNENYRLYFGNPQAGSAGYDLARFFNLIDLDQVQSARLGSVIDNPDWQPPAEPVVPFTERHRYLLDLSLVGLTLVVGLLVLIYLYRKNKLKIDNQNHA